MKNPVKSAVSKKNSQNGTICIPENKKSLSPSDICAILESCKAASVAELQFGDLYVRFDRPVETAGWLDSKVVHKDSNVEQARKSPVNEITEIQKQEEDRELISEEIRMREEQISNALVEDPARAEELILKGDLDE